MERRRMYVEAAADSYAQVRSIDGERRSAFIAGATWLARWMLQMQDHGALFEGSADAGTKKLLDDLTMKDIRKQLGVLLAYEEQLKGAPDGGV